MSQKETKSAESEDTSAVDVSEMKKALAELDEIKSTLLDKATEVEELHSITVEQEKLFQDQIAEKDAKIADLEKALESANKAKEEFAAELTNIKEEAMLRNRLEILKEKSLLRIADEAREKQLQKVKVMSEEEFASYVEDLSDAREQALASTKPSDEGTNKSTESDADSAKPEEKVADEIVVADASGEEDKDLVKKVLSSLSKKDEPVQAEPKADEEAKKETASVRNCKVDARAMADKFSKLISMNLDKNEDKGWL